MIYQEFLPAPELRTFIHLYAILDFPESLPKPVQEKVPPSPGMSLFFCYRREHPVFLDNGAFRGELPCSFLMGQERKSNVWGHKGGFGMFIVLLKPGRRHFFYSIPPGKPAENFLAVNDSGDLALQQLSRELLLADSIPERIQLANAFFAARLRPGLKENDLAQGAIQLIHAHPQYEIQKLSQELYVTPRHLRRAFGNQMGVSLKSYQQLIRICGGIHKLLKGQFQKLSDIAFDCGYYDQSHFNSVFKSFTGLTPNAFLTEKPPISSVVYWREDVMDGTGFLS